TKIRAKRVEDLQSSLGFAGSFAVDSAGLSGSIGMFWSRDVSVELKNYSQRHIDVLVTNKLLNSPPWRFTSFYGAPRAEERHHSWRFLRSLHAIPHDAWLCMGDFNETLYSNEHFSHAARPERQMRAFREVTNDISFQDLGWSGTAYTWDNRQSGVDNVKARLDRAFANENFRQQFQYIRVQHLSSVESDHCFVVAEIKETFKSRSRAKKQFRYGNVWQTHSDYDRLVSDTWRGIQCGSGLQGIASALGELQATLEPWGPKEFGCLTRRVGQLQKKLDRLRSLSIGRDPLEAEQSMVKKLMEALH
uniref:Endonuclease/exonuclease/phosphatase domain-containing protein n=1 Tax=Aegilops tauschii subsp. strangulata TaxID=200361 RepID=A0A453C055_AEGTS